MRRIDAIVLHYTATYPDQDLGAADLDKMHRARGWSGIGYHYVIKRDGTVEKGRPDEKVGAHVSGHNAHTIGITCVGGIERATGPNVGVDNRTDAQKDATIRLLHELLTRHPNARVTGHRDMPGAATQCPGFDAAAWWAEITRQAQGGRPISPPPRSPRPVLRRGARGPAVAELQRALRIAEDEAFGPGTEAALIAFQRRRQLRPDGVCGPMTWAALLPPA